MGVPLAICPGPLRDYSIDIRFSIRWNLIDGLKLRSGLVVLDVIVMNVLTFARAGGQKLSTSTARRDRSIGWDIRFRVVKVLLWVSNKSANCIDHDDV